MESTAGYPQLLFIKIVNVRNTKLLNGIDGALICDLQVEGSSIDYQPFDIVLRRPKNQGLQKNTFVFHLPQPVPKFTLSFKKKYSSKHQQQQQQQQNQIVIPPSNNNIDQTTTTTTTNNNVNPTPPNILSTNHSNNENIIAKVNVSLQYSSLPSLPRRSSFNSLSVLPPANNNPTTTTTTTTTTTNANHNTSGSTSPQISPRSLNSSDTTSNSNTTTPLLVPLNSSSSSASGSPQIHPSSSPIAINSNSNNNNSNHGAPASPMALSGSPSISGSPSYQYTHHGHSNSHHQIPPPYSLSAPASPSDALLSGSPSFISYNGGNRYQANPTPIYASYSTSSPSLATAINSDEEQIRIESSMKWYKIFSPANSPSSPSSSNSTTASGVNPLNGSNGMSHPSSSHHHQHHHHHNHSTSQPVGIPHSTSSNSIAGLHTLSVNSETESTYSTDDPEIQLQISYEHSNIHNLTRIKSYHKELLELIVTPKLGFVHAICDSVDITASQSMAKSLVDVFHSHHKLLHLLKSFMKKEVAQCHDPGTLFRSNSVAMKMVVAYGHKTAQHYLQQTLTPLVVDLCNSPLSLEVDPVKLPPGEDADLNLKNLKIISQKFFDRIVQSIDLCPKSIIEICYYFKKIVSRKFPTHWKSAVGGFIFLRLFCPACVSPENAGIISSGRVGITERRALVLVAKCLQNLSNQVTFNQPYMETINDFIHNNTPALEEFFIKLASRPSEDQTIDGMMVTEEYLHDGIVYLQQFIDKNQEKIFQILDTNTSLSNSDRPKLDKVLDAIESSKKAILSSSSSITALIKGRSNSAGSPTMKSQEIKKPRSNSDNKESPKWSSLTKNLKMAKQSVITPTLNVISGFPKSDEEVVINIDQEWTEKSRPVHIVSIELLRTVTTICKANRLSDTQSIKMNGQPVNWAQVYQTPEYNAFARDVCELQMVYFENMSSEYIAAVFINIYNLMIIHLHFLIGPPNSEVRRKMYNMHKYNIGGNLYSLNDIQHGILRANPKNSLSRVRQIRGGDKRRAFVLPNMDPRFHFALFCVNITIPCLRIFSPETLLEDLHRCGEEFCSSKIDICIKKKEISLPKVFSHFGTDFGKSRVEMLKWIFQFLTSAKRTELIELLEKPSFICMYRTESWNPITYKTKFLNDIEEKEQVAAETEKKQMDKDKVLRRKSRSLTHGNRMSPSSKKDSSAVTLINSLKQSTHQSTKQILTTLNEIVKSVSESLDLNYVGLVLDLLRSTTKQLSFHEWQKSSMLSAISSTDKPTPPLKPQNQLFSNHQIYCLAPTVLSRLAPSVQELYGLSLSIEKEMNKFLDFMEIASFAQSNDISELLTDISGQIVVKLQQLNDEHDSLSSVKETLSLTIAYFTISIATKSQIPQPSTSEDHLLSSILVELGLDPKKKVDTNVMSKKISDIGNQLNNSKSLQELNTHIQKIKKIGKLLSLFEEQTIERYSPRLKPILN
eukprot:gene6819-8458_t